MSLKHLQMLSDKVLFDCSLQLKKLFTLPNPISDPLMESSATMVTGVKLPKIDVPTFNSNILNWQTFWEQFSIAIHEHSSLSDTEKLVYLSHSKMAQKRLLRACPNLETIVLR